MAVFNEYYYLKYLSKDNFYKIKLYGYEKESGTLFDIESNRVYNTKNNLFIEDLKRHRNYYFGLTNIRALKHSRSLHIFDKRTQWEVARY